MHSNSNNEQRVCSKLINSTRQIARGIKDIIDEVHCWGDYVSGEPVSGSSSSVSSVSTGRLAPTCPPSVEIC